MDIDLLWSLGGLCRFNLLPDCMAAFTTPNSEPSTKSQPLFLFLVGLLFIFLFLVRPADQLRSSIMASSIPASRLLSESSASATTPTTTTTTTTTTNLHPQKTQKSHTSPSTSTHDREFEAGAHEVPSGPNPISNR
ncbi:hypothetical protein L1049_005051 [Liquidambar formosana]|uniref:CLAVATA3/ESR (CLE)-related protein 44 n=1 Tax=Liquidambar formosana TaxID=63359 RepID=A0AAP0RUG3_LIQFO